MNMKYISILSICVIAMIGLGCVDKPVEKASPTNIPTQTNVPIDTDTPVVTSIQSVSPAATKEPITTTSENIAATDTPVKMVENVSDNTTSGDTSIEDNTSVTETFKIGDEKNILGVNIKLVNITDYDNDTAIINIEGNEYTYSSYSNSTIQVKGLEILDITSSEDDNTADITVDRVSS